MTGIARPTTIVIQDASGIARKITKIVHHSDGGFAVLAPYHKAQSGLLLKLPVDYNVKGTMAIPLEECIGYTADDRVKLSFHPDGFVQFSGENPATIVSGRDPTTGEAKGLGLISNPLSNPIRSGPTFGISVWGLHDFEKLEPDRDDVVSFAQEEMYYRCIPGTENGAHVEAFLLEPRYWSGVRGKQSAMTISLCVGMFEASGTALDCKVIPLRDSDTFVAALASHVHMRFPEESGFTLSGPSESVKENRKFALMAMYPSTMREILKEHVKVSKDLTFRS